MEESKKARKGNVTQASGKGQSYCHAVFKAEDEESEE